MAPLSSQTNEQLREQLAIAAQTFRSHQDDDHIAQWVEYLCSELNRRDMDRG